MNVTVDWAKSPIISDILQSEWSCCSSQMDLYLLFAALLPYCLPPTGRLSVGRMPSGR